MKWAGRVWILALAGLAGCGWFETRSPLSGEVETPVPWVTPSEPERVLANMDSAMTYLDRGIDNYEKCYADTFHFYPTETDQAIVEAQGRPNAYDGWTKDVERDVMDLILTRAKDVELQFVSRQVIADETLYKVWEEKYELFISETGGGSNTYQGVARLEIRADPDQANQWYITVWQDFLTPGQPDSVHTWGWLRGQRRPL